MAFTSSSIISFIRDDLSNNVSKGELHVTLHTMKTKTFAVVGVGGRIPHIQSWSSRHGYGGRPLLDPAEQNDLNGILNTGIKSLCALIIMFVLHMSCPVLFAMVCRVIRPSTITVNIPTCTIHWYHATKMVVLSRSATGAWAHRTVIELSIQQISVAFSSHVCHTEWFSACVWNHGLELIWFAITCIQKIEFLNATEIHCEHTWVQWLSLIYHDLSIILGNKFRIRKGYHIN